MSDPIQITKTTRKRLRNNSIANNTAAALNHDNININMNMNMNIIPNPQSINTLLDQTITSNNTSTSFSPYTLLMWILALPFTGFTNTG